jgi:hypothetical protein
MKGSVTELDASKSVLQKMAEDPLLKDQIERFKGMGVENSFIISPMMERKRFIQ